MKMAKPPDPVYVIREEKGVYSSLFWQNRILAGREDGKICEWNLKTLRKENTILNAGTSPCIGLKMVNETLVSQEKNGQMNIWIPCEASWCSSNVIHSKHCGFCKIDVAIEHGGIVAYPKRNSVVDIYSLKSSCKIMSFQRLDDVTSKGDIFAIKIIHLNQEPYLLTGHENGQMYLWDFKMQCVVSQLKIEDCILSLDFNENSKIGICSTVEKHVVNFKITQDNQIGRLKDIQITNPGANNAKIRSDGKILALGCWDGSLRLFSCKSHKLLALLKEHSQQIVDLNFITCHSLYNMVATGTDGKISLWNLYS